MEICFVDDCRLQAVKLKKALGDLSVGHDIKIFDNAIEVLFLMRTGNLKPNLLVVDLNMPQMTGIELIRELKEDTSFNHIPIIVMTSSSSRRDVIDCYRYSVAGYFNKSNVYSVYLKTLRTMLEYWEMNVFLKNC